MTLMDTILVAAGVIGFAFHLGWWAGARWRRAHDAARYAQIEARKHHALALKRAVHVEGFKIIDGATIVRTGDKRMPWEGGEPYFYLVSQGFVDEALRQASVEGVGR
jgi:hypothetical protein